jgi:hypothetical protein
LKKDVVNISDALDKVLSLNGVTYTPNETATEFGYTSTKSRAGLLAHELEAVLPEAVKLAPFDTETDDDGNDVSKSGKDYMTVQYEQVIPLLVEAIKQLTEKVKQLENR